MKPILQIPKIYTLYLEYGALFSGFFLRGLSVILSFSLIYYISHRFGPAGSGYYAIITQTGMFLSLVVLGGIDFAVVREYSAARSFGTSVARSSLGRLFAFTLISNVLTMVALSSLPLEWVSKLLSIQPTAFEYIMLGIIMMSRSVTRLSGAFLRSQGDHKLGQTIEVIIIPLIVIASILIYTYRNVQDILILTMVAGAISAVIGIVLSFRHSTGGSDNLDVRIQQLLKVGIPLWGVSVSLNLADWYGVVIVSANFGIHDAGVFRVAMQVGTAMMFGVGGIMTVFSAQVAQAHHEGDITKIGRLARKSVLLNLMMIVTPVMTLAVFAPEVLRFFGEDFIPGANVLRIILSGQLLYGLLAPSGVALAMMGFSKVNLIIITISTFLFLIIAPAMTNQMGLTGTAIAMVFFLVGRNLMAFLYLYIRLGLNGLTGHLRIQKSITT